MFALALATSAPSPRPRAPLMQCGRPTMALMSRRSLPIAIILVSLASALPTAQRRGGAGNPSPDALSFRFLGPVVGNRVASIAGVPGDSSIYYAGAASGGVWKTTDGGLHWNAVSDSMPVAAIGALAVAPSDPSIILAGTGEAGGD